MRWAAGSWGELPPKSPGQLPRPSPGSTCLRLLPSPPATVFTLVFWASWRCPAGAYEGRWRAAGCGAGLGCVQTLGAGVHVSLWSWRTPAEPESQPAGQLGAHTVRLPNAGQCHPPDPGHTHVGFPPLPSARMPWPPPCPVGLCLPSWNHAPESALAPGTLETHFHERLVKVRI